MSEKFFSSAISQTQPRSAIPTVSNHPVHALSEDVRRTAGRGFVAGHLAQAQPVLAGPVRGVGGPSPGMVLPQISRPPVAYSQKQQQPSVVRPPPKRCRLHNEAIRQGLMPMAPPPFSPGGPPGGFVPRPPPPRGQMMQNPMKRGPPPPGGPPRPGMAGQPEQRPPKI